jgi:pimeloyl-ACP methyl ester carboxylesterase
LEKVSGGRKAILVAHDWGGALAWIYAAQYPETLEKLVIINAPHPTIFARELKLNPRQQQASSYMTFFRSPGAEAALRANNYAALGTVVIATNRPDAFTADDKRAYLAAWAQPGALTGGLNYYRASKLGPPPAAAPDAPERGDNAGKTADLSATPLPIVQTPTLVLWGEKDSALLTGNLEGLDKLVKNLTIKRIPSAGHWVVHEEPETINRAIREFLRSPQ